MASEYLFKSLHCHSSKCQVQYIFLAADGFFIVASALKREKLSATSITLLSVLWMVAVPLVIILVFFVFNHSPIFSTVPLTFITLAFRSFVFSAIREVLSAQHRLLPSILKPHSPYSNLVSFNIYLVYRLIKERIQLSHSLLTCLFHHVPFLSYIYILHEVHETFGIPIFLSTFHSLTESVQSNTFL